MLYLDKCTVTVSQMESGKAPYIEKDGVSGFSAGDQSLTVGDMVNISEIVQVDECNEW